ncbi:hypothetical protein AWB78_07090 [Caballeronia calidae]|uniref:Uncharacterized protein n=1 Tax=Caballeronia calidae TaxID=1777139 RepID=A0A158EFJ8_9BURK|nr:hypothetical protein [Caballeronia calidae]SAL04677.1 hypothetical protein AWB78_07090 [Caballeronia calidae]
MEDFKPKIYEENLPSYIDKVWLQELRERAAQSRRAELLALKILGYEEKKDSNARFIEHLMNFPAIDCEDAIFDRHATYDDDGEPNVSG